ncbi:ATP-binding cassette domain-containing protein [Arthrobacter sp. FW305-BF8]|uniref:ATP-binding cassette domain-containing protein n=1 Tax=Arthrobacter sp. FW305-BF8 TaxID=2879617 RepID=UPI001F0271B4|nr:ATP-binding cassette domain-containing protein [Arthrobacter sp. FW305-BF8]UKA55196.1 ATP-binding cassette domain-containing protein [Arthrobacter sp. FW305-BF8]
MNSDLATTYNRSGAPTTNTTSKERSDANTLELSHVTKRFPGVTALDAVSFNCRPGEVHALVGENGSGKSTLIKVAAGVVKPDDGEVRVGNVPLRSADPREARRLGLSTAYQDTSLVNELTVAQNLQLSFQGVRKSPPKDVSSLLSEYELPFGPGDHVRSLGPGARQMLEVVRSLCHEPRALILDEPTAALDMQSAGQLQEWIRRARDKGIAIVYVSHRLEEIRQLADRLTVIRDGVMRGTYSHGNWSVDEIVELMVGAKVELEFPRRPPVPENADTRLELTDLVGPGIGPLSLRVRSGEVIGIAGAEGNGQRQLLRALGGSVQASSGTTTIDGTTRQLTSPTTALSSGIMLQSGDRAAESMFPSLPVFDNATFQLGRQAGPSGLAVRSKLLSSFRAAAARLGIVASSPYQPIGALSGGNQQKVVLSRALLRKPRVLVLDEPTQGVDAKARLDIYSTISEAASEGVGVLINSSDSGELAGLCDRVYVMSDGRIIDEVRSEFTETDIVRRFVTTTGKRANEERVTQTKSRSRGRLLAGAQVPTAALLAIILALAIYVQSQTASFLSPGSIGIMTFSAMPLLFAVLGQQFALISGGFDISIGASMTLAVVTASYMFSVFSFDSLLLTLAISLGLALAVGSFNAVLTLALKINPLVATIGTTGILTGAAVLLRPAPAGQIAPEFGMALRQMLGFVPYCFVAVVILAVLLDVWLLRSGSGLSMRAVGLDPEASRRIGLTTTWLKAAAYAATALGAVIGGLFLSAQVGIGSNDVGLGFALPAFAACFLGGATLTGGRGTFSGASLGVLLLTMISSAALLLGYPYAVSQIIYGAVLLIAVASFALIGRRPRSRRH